MKKWLACVVLLAAGCITPHTQERVLVPAIVGAWPGVRADAQLGGAAAGLLELWDSAVEVGTRSAFLGLDWPTIEAHGMIGVEIRLSGGEIGMVGASILRDRILTFGAAVAELQRVVAVRTSVVDDDVVVISRSSWAKTPPKAIARRTYR